MSVLSDAREIVSEYLAHRELVQQLVLRDLRVRYKQAAMGFLWALLIPALVAGIGVVARIALSGEGPSAPDRALLGAVALRSVLWTGFAASLTMGTASLVANSQLVGKVYFPREVLPLAAVIAATCDMTVALAVLAVLLPWLGAQLSGALIWVPLLLAAWFSGAFALALLLSAGNLFFRDVKYVVQAGLSAGVLITPVFYASYELAGPAARWIRWNPLAPFFDGLTLAIFEGHNLLHPLIVSGDVRWNPLWLATAVLGALGLLIAASVIFHRAEGLFAERV